MQENMQANLTDRNLDWLAHFLTSELAHGMLMGQIPTGAHIFPGFAVDPALTKANLRLASKILLGMALGYVEEAPIVMVYEDRHHEQTVLNLSDKLQGKHVRTFVEGFQDQSQQLLSSAIQQLEAE